MYGDDIFVVSNQKQNHTQIATCDIGMHHKINYITNLKNEYGVSETEMDRIKKDSYL